MVVKYHDDCQICRLIRTFSAPPPLQEKNRQALAALCRIVRDVVWANIHHLPPSLSIYEVRNSLGYGARWSADGKVY